MHNPNPEEEEETDELDLVPNWSPTWKRIQDGVGGQGRSKTGQSGRFMT
jgi:hypothetical protein